MQETRLVRLVYFVASQMTSSWFFALVAVIFVIEGLALGSKKECFATLVTSSEFVQGAVVLARAIHPFEAEVGGRPFLALVYDDLLLGKNGRILRQTLEAELIDVVPVPWIGMPEGPQAHYFPQYSTTYMKFHLWNLTGYDTVLYLDADAFPLVALSDVFERNISVGTVAAAPDICLPDSFNAGVSVRALSLVFLSLRSQK